MFLSIEFQKGENLKVKIIDNVSEKPVPFAKVEIVNGKFRYYSLLANEHGEIILPYLTGEVSLNVITDSYAPFNLAIDISTSKEVLVKLIKGGRLKGKLTLEKDVLKTSVKLMPLGIEIVIGPDGEFEFLNLNPGKYSLLILRDSEQGFYLGDDSGESVLLPNKYITTQHSTRADMSKIFNTTFSALWFTGNASIATM